MTRYRDDEVRKALRASGVDVLDERGGELIARCPGHRGRTGHEDTNPSWSINAESGVHYCFSCHFKGSLFSLVSDLRGQAFAVELLGQESSLAPKPQPGYRVNRSRNLADHVKMPKPRAPKAESMLALFVDPPDWALSARGLDRAAVDFYGVRWDEDTSSWILPIRDPDGGLMGYQSKGQRDRVFRNVPPGMRKSGTLFGYVQVLDHQYVVVVESPLDAVLLNVLGRPAVAVMGSRLSSDQVELLNRFERVVLALDNDDAGRQEMDRLQRMNRIRRRHGSDAVFDRHLGFRYDIVEYTGPEKDFGEMSQRDVDAVLSRIGI